ncbi:MAG: hypothetical protein ABIJ34_04240 [archaeon]
MKKRSKEAVLLTVVAACLAYLLVYGTDVPVRMHENVHLQLHKYFTGESCNMTSARTPQDDNLLHEGYTWQVQCSKHGTELQEKITRLGAFTFEIILVAILLLTPISLLGGFWFLRLAKIFMLDSLVPPSDLQSISPALVRAAGVFFLILFLLSFWIQWKWIRILLLKYRKHRKLAKHIPQ